MAPSLTARQQAFVREYLADEKLDGTAAAVRAGYAKSVANRTAYKLLRNPQVRAAVDAAMAARASRVEVRGDDVLRELLAIARADVGTAFDKDGQLLPLAKLPADTRRALASVEAGALGVTKVRFWDKPKALELLGRHLGLFVDRVQHEGTLTLEQLVTTARAPRE